MSTEYTKSLLTDLLDTAQALYEVAVNDDFLDLVREVNQEQDQDNLFNTKDTFHLLQGIEDALQKNLTNMHPYFDDYQDGETEDEEE